MVRVAIAVRLRHSNSGLWYLDVSTAVSNQVVTVGNRDRYLDPGESLMITGKEGTGETFTYGPWLPSTPVGGASACFYRIAVRIKEVTP
jgi:hypothetical protein